ncbi:MAG: NfeD family protein, partial [Janthinobacterium lividum]|nr:NfeD family protein [Janthinobacterium lividum]
MAEWVGWFVAAGMVLILELFTGTFYLLMIAIGIAAGGLVALAGGNGFWQAVTAAI